MEFQTSSLPSRGGLEEPATPTIFGVRPKPLMNLSFILSIYAFGSQRPAAAFAEPTGTGAPLQRSGDRAVPEVRDRRRVKHADRVRPVHAASEGIRRVV